MSVNTIKSPRDIDALFKGGRRGSHQLVTALISATPDGRGQEGRVVFVAGKRIGNAVFRNRAKRVLRASVRRLGGPWPGIDVALVARGGTGSASADDLDRAILRAVDRAKSRTP